MSSVVNLQDGQELQFDLTFSVVSQSFTMKCESRDEKLQLRQGVSWKKHFVGLFARLFPRKFRTHVNRVVFYSLECWLLINSSNFSLEMPR